MRNRNVVVLVVAVCLVVLVALVSLLPQARREITADAPLAPVETAAQTEGETQPVETVKPQAYLLAGVCGMLYEPIPLMEEGEYTVRQADGKENVIHVTADSVSMKSSSCDNQDCVQQGTVTLENMGTRVLSNMIICLPNQVTLELHTPESLAQVLVQAGE